MDTIDLSPVEHKIKSTAFTLFREWTQGVKTDFPQLEIIIKNEAVLGEDLTDSITSALKSLDSEQNENYTFQWKIGFFLGFVQSSLNEHWCNEYVHKQGNTYNMIVMLQSIRKYLFMKESAREQIEEIYEKALEDHINLAHYNTAIAATKETVISHMEIPLLGKIHHHINHPAITCCENIIVKMINEFAEQDNKTYLPEMEDYFDTQDVTSLIRLNCKRNP